MEQPHRKHSDSTTHKRIQVKAGFGMEQTRMCLQFQSRYRNIKNNIKIGQSETNTLEQHNRD